jgi:hypothetical protein
VIKAYCRTNLDTYKCARWPTQFVCTPRIGDWVKSQCGKKLRVMGITHLETAHGEPLLELELHK